MERQPDNLIPLAPKVPTAVRYEVPNEPPAEQIQRDYASRVQVAPKHRNEPKITQPRRPTTKKPKKNFFGWLSKKLTGRKKRDNRARVTPEDIRHTTPGFWDTTQGIGEARTTYTRIPTMTTTIWADPPPKAKGLKGLWDKIRRK